MLSKIGVIIRGFLGTVSIVIFVLMAFSANRPSTVSKPIYYPRIAQDELIGRPISSDCREAYTVLCPTYHGD